MKKKLFSIALIVVLISFTVAPLWGYSCISYGADTSTVATSDEKEKAAISVYFNYRGGYFVDSVGGSANAIAIAVNLVREFYDSSSNTSDIKSTADFLAHVTMKSADGHWGVNIDNQGILFLDHLVKWILGKNTFPNLYSGGAWGSSEYTTDLAYNGYSIGSNNVYIIKQGVTSSNPTGSFSVYDSSDIAIGSVVNGCDSNYFYTTYMNRNSSLDFNNPESNPSNNSVPVSITYSSNITENLNLERLKYSSGSLSSYSPMLKFSGYPSILYCNNNNRVRGSACWFVDQNYYSSRFYYGIASYDYTTDTFSFSNFGYYARNNVPGGVNDLTVNFETDNFDKNDVGFDDNSSPGLDFIPQQEGDNNTYNYYNYNDYSEKQFIEDYIEKYVIKKTIIENPNPDPGGGGGSVTPGTGSGSITPDGNGGFNFNLPDIGWPDFSGFDFNLSGLSEKFPFSIPFDLMAFFTVLNAEPETPEVQGDIDLGIVNWEIDWDLHDFDTLAALLRNLEFIGFCISLILITRSIIKG